MTIWKIQVEWGKKEAGGEFVSLDLQVGPCRWIEQQPRASLSLHCGGGGLYWVDLVMGLWWKSGGKLWRDPTGEMFSSLSASFWFSTLFRRSARCRQGCDAAHLPTLIHFFFSPKRKPRGLLE